MRTWFFIGLCALATACNDPGLIAQPQRIFVTPDAVDFGEQALQAGGSEQITIQNVGGKALNIHSIFFEPVDPVYVLAAADGSLDTPFSLEPQATKVLDLSFLPNLPGPRPSELVIISDDPDRDSVRVPLSALAFVDQVDHRTQGEGAEADLMFVVDNSGSMGDDQVKLANSFQTFINWLTGHQVSFQIGITTTDVTNSGEQGMFVGSPNILDNSTPNLVSTFQNNVKVGTMGSADELGFDAAVRALHHPSNGGFVRGRSTLYIIFVSDEDDQSEKPVNWYVDVLTIAKDGNPEKIFFSSIAGPMPDGCDGFGASEAPRYNDIVDTTGGLFGSICDDDFGVTLQNLAFAITEPSPEFFLEFVPDPATLSVRVAGVEQPKDRWAYDAVLNLVRFLPQWVPENGADVEILYKAIDTPAS